MLEVRNLQCAYLTAKVLNGVDLSVGDSEVVALLGRNGMGKTSLVRCLFNLQPPQVSGGWITYRGHSLSAMPSHMIARAGLGLVPQGRRVFKSLTVEENLTTTARSAAEGTGEWTVDKVYDFFPRLAERRNNKASNLSGGEQQMLAIGRALMGNPTLLVMDEASEGLAPAVLRDIRDRLRDLKSEGLSVFFVEQNIGMALSLADRIYVLGANGTIAWTGDTSEFGLENAGLRSHLGV